MGIERIIIDDFSLGHNVNSVEIQPSTEIGDGVDASVSAEDPFNAGSGCGVILGCIRDMHMTVFASPAGRRFTSEIFAPQSGAIFPGEWAVSNPKGGKSTAILQYDGSAGFTDPPSEVFSVDLTTGRSGAYFFFSVLTDLNINYFIDIYDDTSVCTLTLPVTGIEGAHGEYDYSETFFFIDVSDFTGAGCDTTDISAVELELPSFDAVDAIVRRISIYTPPDPTPTGTPTPTQTRTPAASGTGTPSRTGSPSGPCITFCTCPSFTCQIAYDIDDDVNDITFFQTSYFFFDDSDTVIYVDDDAGTSDDEIVYVVTTVFVYVDDDDDISTGFSTFFSTGFSTFFSTGFTSFFSSFTSFTTFSTNFNFSTSSDAGTLAVSTALVALLAVLA